MIAWKPIGAMILSALCVLWPAVVSAQVGTQPMAWPPGGRPFADAVIGTALVALQAEEAARYSIVEWRRGDRIPAYQNLCAVSSAMVTTEILKRKFPETRPDGSDQASWPSGHSATLAAMQGRHLTVTIAVTVSGGLSRAWANKHHFWDGGEGDGRGKGKDIPIGWLIGIAARTGCSAIIRH